MKLEERKDTHKKGVIWILLRGDTDLKNDYL